MNRDINRTILKGIKFLHPIEALQEVLSREQSYAFFLEKTRPIEEAIVLLKEAEEERTEADKKLMGILEKVGLV